ncbi:MAG TPA: tetratricopeptide repeat protein [Pyrinomonadaceae bacterium]
MASVFSGLRSESESKSYRLLLIACLLFPAVTTAARAQGGGIDPTGTGGRHSISGRLVFPSGQRADLRLKVRLESSGGDLTLLSDMNGNFKFQSLRPGHYTVVVEGGELFETVREAVFIESGSVSSRRMPGTIPVARPFNVLFYLRLRGDNNSSTRAGVLNAALAGIPKDAVTLYHQALESASAGNLDKAISELQQALALYPNFGLAHSQLGLQYLRRGKLDKAADSLRTGMKLSPDDYETQLNYGVVLLNQMKFADAEQQLRSALKKNYKAFAPHLYLGMALVNLKNYQEAETSLQKAVTLGGDKVAQAHYFLGGIYWRARDYPRAASELERYLQLEPKAPNAEKIRATIKELRTK